MLVISYQQLLKIANVSFAIAFLLFLMATIFIIPLQQSNDVKQGILFGIFVVAYFVITIFAVYDQNRHIKMNDKNTDYFYTRINLKYLPTQLKFAIENNLHN